MKKLVSRIDSSPDWKIAVFLYFVFAVPAAFAASLLRVPLVKTDTVSTIAITAALAGDDWSMAVRTFGSYYYKPGAALLYYPIYRLFHSDPAVMYGAMCVCNMLLVSFLPVCVYRIQRRYLQIEKSVSLCAAAASAGISSIWLYSSFPKGEALTIFYPLPVLLVMLELFCRKQSEKKRIVLSVLSALLLVLAYLAHTRGIILLIAGVTVCVPAAFLIRDRKTLHIPAFVLSLVFFLLAEEQVSAFCRSKVFLGFDVAHNTLGSLNVATILHIFSLSGLKVLLRVCTGWVYILGVSTYGLFFAGVFAAAFLLWKGIAGKSANEAEMILASFSLLYAAGCFALGVLFIFPYAWDFVQENALLRADRMFYERYMATAEPPLLLTAFYVFFMRKDAPRKGLLWTAPVYAGIAAVFLAKVAPPYLNSTVNVTNFLTSTAFFQYKGSTNTYFPELISAFLKITLVNGAVLLAFLFLACRKKKACLAMSLILIASAANFAGVFSRIRLPADENIYTTCREVYQQIKALRGSGMLEENPKVSVDGTGTNAADYQFLLPDLSMGLSEYFIGDQPEFIAIAKPNRIGNLIGQWDAASEEASCYVLFEDPDGKDSIYVRGEHLAQKLAENGYELKKIE